MGDSPIIAANSPVCQQAGIWDFENILKKYPFPITSIDYTKTSTFGLFLPDMIEHMYDLIGGKGIFYLKQAQNVADLPLLNPLIRNGFIDQISQTDIFRRLFGINQLSFNGSCPILNPHSRAEHSIWFSILASKGFQSLCNDDSQALAETLRKDFKNHNIPQDRLTDEEIIVHGANILCWTTAHHDAATLAGGDSIKYLLKSLHMPYDEENLLGDMLFTHNETFNSPDFQKYRDQSFTLARTHGLTETDLRYALTCIKGSDSLIGLLVNSPKDTLEFDRISYIILDWYRAGLFTVDYLPSVLPSLNQPHLQRRLVEGAIYESQGLDNPDIVYHHAAPIFPWNILDPSNDLVLSKQGEPVFTKPNKMLALAYLRVMEIIYYYAGTKMLGMEKELQDCLTLYIKKNGLPECLTLPNLLSCTSEELFTDLEQLDPKGELGAVVSNRNRWRMATTFSGFRTTDLDEAKKHWGYFPIKIKPGLDTLVLYKNRTTTLGKYAGLDNWRNINDNAVYWLCDERSKTQKPLGAALLRELWNYGQSSYVVIDRKDKEAEQLTTNTVDCQILGLP